MRIDEMTMAELRDHLPTLANEIRSSDDLIIRAKLRRLELSFEALDVYPDQKTELGRVMMRSVLQAAGELDDALSKR